MPLLLCLWSRFSISKAFFLTVTAPGGGHGIFYRCLVTSARTIGSGCSVTCHGTTMPSPFVCFCATTALRRGLIQNSSCSPPRYRRLCPIVARSLWPPHWRKLSQRSLPTLPRIRSFPPRPKTTAGTPHHYPRPRQQPC